MIIYEVDGSPGAYDADGSRTEEYFRTLKAAQRRFREMTRERLRSPDDFAWCGVALRRIVVPPLRKRALVMALLNRKGWVENCTVLADLDPDWFRSQKEVVAS